MMTRTLAMLAAALFATPSLYAEVDGEGPGVRPDRPAGEHKPDLGDRPAGEHPREGELFAKFDHDANGNVSQPEFMHGLRLLMEKRMEGGGDRPRPPEGAGDHKRPEGGGDRPRPPEGAGDRPRPEGGGDRPRPPEGAGDHKRPEGGGDRPRPPEGGGDRPRPPEGAGDERGKMMGEKAEKAFKAGDANGDGALTQEEFRAAMGSLGGGQPPKKPTK
jgi:EF hand